MNHTESGVSWSLETSNLSKVTALPGTTPLSVLTGASEGEPQLKASVRPTPSGLSSCSRFLCQSSKTKKDPLGGIRENGMFLAFLKVSVIPRWREEQSLSKPSTQSSDCNHWSAARKVSIPSPTDALVAQ